MSRGGRYRDEYFRKDGRQSDEFLRSDTRYSDEFVRTDEFSFLNETEMASESFIHSDEFNMDSEVSLKEKSAIEEDFELGGEQEAASQTTMVMGAGTIKVGAITAAAVMSVSTVAINHEHTFAQGWTTTVEATCLHNGTEELICTECHWHTEKNITPKLEHIIGDWMVRNLPSCKSSGLEVRVCTDCQTVLEQRDTGMGDHSWVTSENGTTCSVCGASGGGSYEDENSSTSDIFDEEEQPTSSSEIIEEESSSSSEEESSSSSAESSSSSEEESSSSSAESSSSSEEESSSGSEEVEEESSSSSEEETTTPSGGGGGGGSAGGAGDGTTDTPTCTHIGTKTESVVTRDATCLQEGEVQTKCECGEVIDISTTPLIAHTLTYQGTPPTCNDTVEVVISTVCSVCGTTTKTESVKGGHIFENSSGVCEICGETQY